MESLHDLEKQKEKLKEGYGNCPECVWYKVPKGCNVAKDSAACNLNMELRDTKA